MSSIPIASSFRSRSLSEVVDVIESYRRAQEYLSGSVSASEASADDDFLEPDEPPIQEVDETKNADADAAHYETLVNNLQWDEDVAPGSQQSAALLNRRQFLVPVPRRQSTRDTAAARPTPSTPTPKAEERTPLLGTPTAGTYGAGSARAPSISETSAGIQNAVPIVMSRRTSQLSIRRGQDKVRASKARHNSGRSTYGQTLFNAIAILLGIGMLSEPLAFAYAGWIGGMTIIIFYGVITCYTAKILAHIILDDPRLKSYSDIGRKAFGPRSGPWINALFCLELFTVSVALVTLYADSLYAVMPTFSANTYKLLGIILLIPTMMLPLSVLSFTSIIGIVSTLLIIAVMLIDGLSKRDSPGSIWNPADTSLGVRNVGELGLAFGLFMAGFSGHAVVPSLVRDMIDPTQFDDMITQAFIAATTIYAVIGIAGYLMFGNSVSDEFSQDLAKHSIYPVLNKIALWGLVLAPLSKFALATRPLNLTLEMILGIETTNVSVDDHDGKSTMCDPESIANPLKRRGTLNDILTAVERAIFTACSVAVSIFVPEFASMMAFLGAFSSFLLCVIGPVSAKVALARRCGFWDAFLLVSGLVMATWGTIAAVWSMQ